jgi:hypothetical protein
MILIGAGGAVALSLAAAAMAFGGPGGHDPMTMFDKDGDNALSLAEIRQGAQAMFAQHDSNKDGRISQDEMRAHHDKMGGARHGSGGPHKAGGPAPGGRGPMHMDSDGDGAVSLAEVQSKLESHFARADANSDGSVTRAEMEAAHREMHGRR